MEEKEFKLETKNYIKYIEKCISSINELVKEKEPIRFFDTRLTLFIAACKKVKEGQDLYLNYWQEHYDSDPKDVIQFDYTMSYFANRLYIVLKPMLDYFFSERKHKDSKFNDIPKYKIVDASNLVNDMLYISARWFSERFMNVRDESIKSINKRKLPKRLPLLKDVMPCFDRILAVKMGINFKDGFNPRKLVVCVPPSSGKTYVANVYTVLMLAHHRIRFKETGMIRMTNTGENAYDYGGMVYRMMIEDNFFRIFPELSIYKQGSKVKMFTYESKEKYLLKDCNSECSDSIFMFGAEAQINGKRSTLGVIIDDMSGGQTFMDNDDLHKKNSEKVMSDVDDRSDDETAPFIVMGTMYNENDVQNTLISMWERDGLLQHYSMSNVRYTKDGRCAICLVDVEDENGHSVAPDLYSDKKLQDKKDFFISRGKSYVYNLIYRQKKDSREPKTFADETLMHYKWGELPEDISEFSLSMMDLTRKTGNDYFANPYLRFCPSDGLYYLTDAIFEQKSLGLVDDPKNDFRDKVCGTIISNKTVECCIENNTSNTTGSLLKQRCQELNYKGCKFRERYTSKKGNKGGKTQRILNQEETIKNYIVFPEKNTIPVGHPLFQAMEQLNNWNSKDNSRNNHDDFPDVLAMFSEEFIFKRSNLGEIGGLDLEKTNFYKFF